MGLRGAAVALCLVVLLGCPRPPTPTLGFPGPEPIARWDTAFGADLPLTIFYPTSANREPRPVVIFTAGWNQTRGSYLGYGEELAQWGYVAIIRAYPNPSLLGIGIDTSELQTQQITDLIDWCAAENVRAESPLAGLVDATRVGTTGHSYGAAVSVDAALRDPRIGAVVDLDAIVVGKRSQDAVLAAERLGPVSLPILWIGTDKGAICSGPRGPNALPLFDLANAPTEEVIVRGAAHIDFIEQGEGLNNLGQIVCGGGTADKNEVRAIGSRYMIAWFNVYLQNKPEFRRYLDGADAQQDIDAGKVSARIKSLDAR